MIATLTSARTNALRERGGLLSGRGVRRSGARSRSRASQCSRGGSDWKPRGQAANCAQPLVPGFFCFFGPSFDAFTRIAARRVATSQTCFPHAHAEAVATREPDRWTFRPKHPALTGRRGLLADWHEAWTEAKLRGTFAVLQPSAGTHFVQVSKWLGGHSIFTLTLDTYGDYIPKQDGGALNNLPEPPAPPVRTAERVDNVVNLFGWQSV